LNIIFFQTLFIYVSSQIWQNCFFSCKFLKVSSRWTYKSDSNTRNANRKFLTLRILIMFKNTTLIFSILGVDVKFVDVKSMYYMNYTNDETALLKGQKQNVAFCQHFYFKILSWQQATLKIVHKPFTLLSQEGKSTKC